MKAPKTVMKHNNTISVSVKKISYFFYPCVQIKVIEYGLRDRKNVLDSVFFWFFQESVVSLLPPSW